MLQWFHTIGDSHVIDCYILKLYDTSRIQNGLFSALVESTFP